MGSKAQVGKEEGMHVDGQWFVSMEGEEEGFLCDTFDVSLGVAWKDRGWEAEVCGREMGWRLKRGEIWEEEEHELAWQVESCYE